MEDEHGKLKEKAQHWEE